MACCAAAIFLVLQFFYGAQRLLAFVSRGRWGGERPAFADAASAWRQSETGSATLAPSSRWRISRRRTLALAAAPALVTALFVLTKPGVPSPIPQSELLAMLHAKICGHAAAFIQKQ